MRYALLVEIGRCCVTFLSQCRGDIPHPCWGEPVQHSPPFPQYSSVVLWFSCDLSDLLYCLLGLLYQEYRDNLRARRLKPDGCRIHRQTLRRVRPVRKPHLRQNLQVPPRAKLHHKSICWGTPTPGSTYGRTCQRSGAVGSSASSSRMRSSCRR